MRATITPNTKCREYIRTAHSGSSASAGSSEASLRLVQAHEPETEPGSAPVLCSAYLSAREAADYLRLPRRTLLDWARQGLLPGIPLGGAMRKTWLFSKSALDAHLRGMMTGNRPCSIKETEDVL
jgi:excisionase family DNA binding protein